MVEFALIAPIFLTLFIGIFEVGRAMEVWASINSGAVEAVRMGVVPGNTTTQITNQAIALSPVAGPAVTSANVTITCKSGCATRSTGDWIVVQINYTFQPAFPLGTLNMVGYAYGIVG